MAKMQTGAQKFKATILSTEGIIPETDTLEYRVLVVRDELSRLRISAQAWWVDEKYPGVWNPGKGYFLTARNALTVGKMIRKALYFQVNFNESIIISDTQQYRISKTSDGIAVSIEKWWRKDGDSDWELGKGLTLANDKADSMARLLEKSGLSILHAR